MIYVVTCGEYSDYHIEKVFSSREKAEAYVAIPKETRQGYLPVIEEYKLDEE